MDFRDSSTTEPSPPSTDAQNNPSQEHVASVSEDLETTCWGCGLHLTVSPYAPAFMCSWCGAITNHKAHKIDNKNFWWRRLQDRCFVCLLFVFMLFMICGGIWAIYPVVFSISYFCGAFHCCITLILSVTTISMYCFAAFRSAGAPPIIAWGSYPVVGRGGLDNYTFCVYCSKPKSPRTHHCRSCGMCVLDMDHHCPFIMKKNQRPWRRLITISTAEGKWHGNWDRDYSFSLRDLQLEDLAEEDGDKNAQVFINLCIHKHAGFGLSVHGGICASFTRKCSNCSAPYCREIDTNFNVWVLPSSRNSSSSPQLPEIGGDDPSVIYVKPGCEADLDSLVQDTIRLTTSVNETCSDLCEKAEPRIQHLSKQNSASIDKRWSRLLELRKAYQ